MKERRKPIVKARLLGLDKPRSHEGGEEKNAFIGAGALVPPYDPETLLYWHEHSSAMRPNVDAMVVNVDGHGHRIEPVIDLRAKDSDEDIIGALMAKAYNQGQDDPVQPTQDEVDAERERISRRMKLERGRLESWLRHAAYEGSFVRLRRRMGSDKEITGNAYAEVLRNKRGQISKFRYMPSYLCRMMPLGERFVEHKELEQLSPIHYEEETLERRFRRFIELDEISCAYIYFKELGDPRVLSKNTGRFYPNEEALRAAEPTGMPATEVVHFKIDAANSPYGVPRWVSAIPEVKGKRAASEVNYFLFDNKSVPPLAIFVSGGKLAEGVDEKIEKFVAEELRGRDNWSKILIVEAESDGQSGTAPRIEIHRLSKEITQDGLFLEYDDRCAQTIGSQWRIPRILRGDTEAFNRATAEAALQMAEDLVFAPERNEFDEWMNSKILPSLGIYTLKFVSLTPSTRNPERLAQNIERLAKVGALTPRDARELSADVFNQELAPIPVPWQEVPVSFTLGGIQTGQGGANLEQEAEKMIDLRDRLEMRAGNLAERRASLVRESMNGDLTVELASEIFNQLVERES